MDEKPMSLTLDDWNMKNQEWHLYTKDSKFILEMDFFNFLKELSDEHPPQHKESCRYLESTKYDCDCGLQKLIDWINIQFEDYMK